MQCNAPRTYAYAPFTVLRSVALPSMFAGQCDILNATADLPYSLRLLMASGETREQDIKRYFRRVQTLTKHPYCPLTLVDIGLVQFEWTPFFKLMDLRSPGSARGGILCIFTHLYRPTEGSRSYFRAWQLDALSSPQRNHANNNI